MNRCFNQRLARWLNDRGLVSGDWPDNTPAQVRREADLAVGGGRFLGNTGWPVSPDDDTLAEAACRLINTVEATGGIVLNEDGTYSCVGDPEWIDLADAYVLACEAFGLKSKVVPR